MLQLATSLHGYRVLAGVITVISCAALAAHGVSSMVASQAVAPSSAVSHPAPTKIAAPPRPRHDGELTARNMFCASCEPSISSASAAGNFTLPPAVLIATSLGDDPRATVHVLGNDAQGSWGLDEAIPGLGRVHRIGWQWIDITTAGGQIGRLQLLDHPVAVPGKGPARPPGTAPDSPFGDRLVELDENTYAVDRSLIRDMFAGASPDVTGRLIPTMRDGQPHGLKVRGVKPGTIPFALHLKDGDELEAVNGIALTSADAMLGLYASMNQLTVVEVSITRRGQPITRSLRLR